MNVQADNLRQLMNDALAVLFDFDGPLCDVFAGLPAPRVARDLERVAGRTFATDDPLEVLRQSAGTASANAVETALTEAEFSAVNQSVANVEGVEVLRKSRARGQAIAVVSNNSRAAVTAFLETHGLTPDVSTVIGRTPGRPDLMKPNPWPVRLALEALGCPSDRAVFVGDTLSDIEAAHSAGVSCVALANKPGKRATFEGLEALVIDSMADLMTRL